MKLDELSLTELSDIEMALILKAKWEREIEEACNVEQWCSKRYEKEAEMFHQIVEERLKKYRERRRNHDQEKSWEKIKTTRQDAI